MTYKVYYMRSEAFSRFIGGFETPRRATLDQTHVYLRDVEAADLDMVYYTSQGEVWSPNGEARDLILAKGLGHTSMSVGDVIEDPDGALWAVAPVGFTPLLS